MNKELLSSYRSKKEEISELRNKLLNMGESDTLIGNDTILNYTSGYPVPQAVVGVDQGKVKRYYKKIKALSKECKEIEDFIESIPDSLIRRIFRMHYIEGLSQKDIAKIIHMEKSNISKKISMFLKLSTNSTNSTL
ncbi:MAG: hypothetical protein NC313_15135 [Butyrivibrio sp.]|nr:hypothetical protein [Butyrivibrio sp.]